MSQTIKAIISLRERILNGEFPPGERMLELALVDELGVSRTPIRAALARLAEEGLLQRIRGGGYEVREFSERDIKEAIEARGTMEGMAARLAAERGVSAAALAPIKTCLNQIDQLLQKMDLDSSDLGRYLDLNKTFHQQILVLADSFVVEHTLGHIYMLPFAAPSAFVMAQSELGHAWNVFFVAQDQHRSIVEAIEQREGTRAEALTREHARLSLTTLRRALRIDPPPNKVPGLKLVNSNE